MFPYEITPIGGNVGKELVELFHGQKAGFVKVGQKKWVLPAEYANYASKYYNFELKKDDVWVTTFPRSGTTLMQEILWQINNDFDYEEAKKTPIIKRSPFLEYNIMLCDQFIQEITELNGNDPNVINELKERYKPGYEIAQTLKSPRLIKSHLPLSLLPPSLVDTCKVVYVARNPYDVAVSFYHHNKLLTGIGYQGDFNKYWELFEKDLVLYSPYWEHLKEGWALKDHPNFLFLFYEDLLRDLPSNLKKICQFLNKQISDEEIKRLADHVQIDNFRENVRYMRKAKFVGLLNPDAQSFIRRGKIGGNVEFDDDMKLRAEKWFKENLAKTDIKFPEFNF